MQILDKKQTMGALQGIRVLDLSTMLSGPFGSMMLGDLGAEIIKIETQDGDNTRTFPPHFHNEESIYYLSLNRNKKSIVLDLKNSQGLNTFYELVKKADVVWDNFRSGVKERLKVDYETIKKFNPAIISCSITAYGENNPYDKKEPIYDLCIQAMSGVLSMTGEKGRPPVKLGVPMADLAAGWYGVVGVLAALVARNQTKVGQKVDIAMLDCLASLHCYEAAYYLYSGIIPERLGTCHRSLVPYQIFQTKDIYIAIVVARDKFWANLCKALGKTELIEHEKFSTIAARYENRSLVVKTLEKILGDKKCAEWLALLKEAGVPCAPVNTLDKALVEPALLHRDMVVEVGHDGETIKMMGNPIKLSNNLSQFNSPPKLGEHTDEVISNILGLSASEIENLRMIKAIG